MFGGTGADRYDLPIFGGLDRVVFGQPAEGLDAEILSIDVEGDVASVKLAESDF
jgi:hypothetical protein